MSEDRKVRSAGGLIAWREDEDHDVRILRMREWCKAEAIAGRPSSLEDFYAAYGICLDCLGHGAQMIGWSKPSATEIQVADGMELVELPLYDVCPTCQGTGKAGREKWKGSSSRSQYLGRVSE